MDTIFYGCGLDQRECELKAMKIDQAHRENEADLMVSRWFDYSNLSPGMATYYYAHLYKAQTAKFYETYVDIRTVEDARSFTPDDIFMSRDMTSMWLARRACDALGIPYEFALQFAQKRALERLFQHFPRPNQLYGEEFEIDLDAAWKESLSRSLRYSRLPRYQAKNYCKSRMQKLHEAFVIGQIKQRAAPHHNVLGRLLSEGVLAERAITDHFHEDVIEQAKEIATKLDSKS